MSTIPKRNVDKLEPLLCIAKSTTKASLPQLLQSNNNAWGDMRMRIREDVRNLRKPEFSPVLKDAKKEADQAKEYFLIRWNPEILIMPWWLDSYNVLSDVDCAEEPCYVVVRFTGPWLKYLCTYFFSFSWCARLKRTHKIKSLKL